jgi:ATP-dependent protease ClpP protease subunit
MEFGRELHEIYNELWNATENDKIELRINSRGGFVNEGAQFYSIIKNKFNGRCTTILDNCGYSMGALTFCMGDKRVATERSDLMFHDYSGGEYGKGGEMKDSLDHTIKHIRQFFHDVIVDQGFLTEKEFSLMLIGKDFWMDTKELCKRGIATHVLVHGEEITAKKYLKRIKKKEKLKKAKK